MKKKEKNPFKIESVPMIGKRSPIDMQTRDQMKRAMMGLQSRSSESFFISHIILKDPRQARSVIQSLKKEIRYSSKALKDVQFVCRTILDAAKKYQGTRVWRTN